MNKSVHFRVRHFPTHSVHLLPVNQEFMGSWGRYSVRSFYWQSHMGITSSRSIAWLENGDINYWYVSTTGSQPLEQ